MTLREMMERRATLRTEMAGLHAAHPAGALSADAEQRWTAAQAELSSIEGRMQRQATIDDLDRRIGAGQPIGGGSDPHFDAFRNGVGILDCIRASMGGTDERSGRAREASQEIARRSGRQPKEGGLLWDMRAAPRPEQRVTTTGAQGTAPIGAALVPTIQRADLFVDILRNRLIARQLGATVLNDLTGNVTIPRRTGTTAYYWVAENQPITPSDQSFDGITLTPKTCGVLTELSRNQILQSSPDVEALTQDDMAKVLAQALDSAALLGSGIGNIPKGVVFQTDPGNIVSTGQAAPTWANVLAVLSALELANATPSAWALGQKTRGLLMGTPKSSTLSLGFLMDDANELAGLPALQTNGLTGGYAIAGDWSDLVIGFWSELEILVNPYATGSYEAGNVKIRALMTCDIAVRHAKSFAILQAAVS